MKQKLINFLKTIFIKKDILIIRINSNNFDKHNLDIIETTKKSILADDFHIMVIRDDSVDNYKNMKIEIVKPTNKKLYKKYNEIVDMLNIMFENIESNVNKNGKNQEK